VKISLNGQTYELRENTGVTREPLQEWSDNIRLDGLQQRKDRRYLSSWGFESWANGLGVKQINSGRSGDTSSLWDAENVDTRFDGQIILSPQLITCTIVPSRGDLNLAIDYLNNIYFAETKRTPNSNLYKYTAPDILGSYRVQPFRGNRAGSLCGIKSFGGKLVILGQTIGSNTIMDVGLVASLGVAPAQSCFVRNCNPAGRFVQIAELNGTYHFSLYDNPNVNYRLLLDDGLVTGSLETVATYNDVVGTQLAPLVSDGVKIYTILPTGLYNFDYVPDVLVDTRISKDANPTLNLFQDTIYFKNKKSLIRFDGSSIANVGYDTKDGLASEKFGEITAMVSNFQWNFCAVRGATYSHILAMDGSHKWQYYARVPSPGLWIREMFLSNSPDAIDRLWIIYHNFAQPGFFYNPLVNPLQAGTYAFVPTGEFTPPIYDGGMAEINAGFYQMNVSGEGLSADNKITSFYGLDGVSPVTSLGVIGTNNLGLIFGSPNGVEGHKIQPRFMLTTGSTAQTPVFKSMVIQYLKDPDKREMYDFDIDLKKSVNPQRGVEAIVGSLNYLANLKTLFPFNYSFVGTRYVKMLNSPFNEKNAFDTTFPSERDAFVHIKLAEMT